jgi:CheY-like chemotaxis protein
MSSLSRPVVLVVDDCECVRAIYKLVLREMAGIHSVGAATSEEALRLAQRRRFDAIISDIKRDGMDGLEFLRMFKQVYPTVPVIIASGYWDEAVDRRVRWFRAFECLPKPFSCLELVAVVRAAIAARRVCRTLLQSRTRERFPTQ